MATDLHIQPAVSAAKPPDGIEPKYTSTELRMLYYDIQHNGTTKFLCAVSGTQRAIDEIHAHSDVENINADVSRSTALERLNARSNRKQFASLDELAADRDT